MTSRRVDKEPREGDGVKRLPAKKICAFPQLVKWENKMDFLSLVAQLPAFHSLENSLCLNHTIMTIQHLTMGSLWALRMVDSSTIIPAGILAGSFTDFGNFHECILLDVNESWGSFKGQHCLASVNVNLRDLESITKMKQNGSVPFRWSLCVPSSCTPENVREVLSAVLHHNVSVDPKGCHTEDPRPYSSLDMVTIFILCFFALICFFSTTYDIIISDPKKRKPLLLAFSWYTNGKQLISTKTNEGTMECLHGIRFLTITWVLIGHVYFMTATIPLVNVIEYANEMRAWGHEFVTGALTAVDTFLLMSGLLLCYIFLKVMHKGQKFNLPLFYFHRFLRTTPLLAIGVLVHAGLIMHMGSGPLWDINMTWITSTCRKNWWTAIFHLQNYVLPNEMCMPVTWYLSVDMQLYLLSPLLLIPLYKKPRTGIILLQTVTVGSIFSCFLQLYLDNDVVPLVKLGTATPSNYYYTHTRAQPWLIGLSMGYLIYTTSAWRKEVIAGSRKGLSKTLVIIGWILSMSGMLASVALAHYFSQTDFPTLIYTTTYTTFSRTIWSLGVAWVVFACVSGYGGPVNEFLSWKVLRPFSRLSYCIYIIHMAFIRVRLYSVKTSGYYSDINNAMHIFSNMVFVILLSIPATLMFEYPTGVIEKVLLGGGHKVKQKYQLPSNNGSQPSQYEMKITNDILSCINKKESNSCLDRTQHLTGHELTHRYGTMNS